MECPFAPLCGERISWNMVPSCVAAMLFFSSIVRMHTVWFGFLWFSKSLGWLLVCVCMCVCSIRRFRKKAFESNGHGPRVREKEKDRTQTEEGGINHQQDLRLPSPGRSWNSVQDNLSDAIIQSCFGPEPHWSLATLCTGVL